MIAALLHRLEPERAHAFALRLVRAAPLPPFVTPPALATGLAGLALAHPVGLAAGFDKSADAFAGLLRLGFASVEVGTVTPRSQAGNPRPRLFRLAEDRALVNRMGFNNDGLDAVAARLAGRAIGKGVVGANIGMNKDAPEPVADYLLGLEGLYARTDYVSVNVSSPNTPGLRALQQADRLHDLLAALVRRRNALAGTTRPKPLFLKVAPDLGPADEAAIAEVALALRIDGLIVSNTTVARPSGLRSPHARETGGLSGAPLFAPSTALLARFARRLEGRLPLIGVGGIASAEAAYAKLRAGATAVQLYTGMIYEGPLLVRRIVRGLAALLARDGLARIGEAVGRDVDRWAEA